jgi:hypothetical protein
VHDLARFTLEDMSRLGGALRRGAQGAHRIDQSASRVVQHLHDSLRDGSSGARLCASARFFMTQLVEDLPPDLEIEAPGAQGEDALPARRCLVLLAKAELEALVGDGLLPPGKRALSLTESGLQSAPVFCALVTQFGLDVASIAAQEPVYAEEASHRACNVFHTEEVPAAIAAQGVRSLLGFGGLLPSGNLFFVMLYLRTLVSPSHAAMFRPVAINIKIPLLPLDGRGAFTEHAASSDRGEDRAG